MDSRAPTAPNPLYKYMSHCAFLENSLFRFSQPSALNDPEEALPHVRYGRYAPEDYEHARLEAQRYGNYDISDEELEAMHLNPYPARRFDEKAFPDLWPAYLKELRQEPFYTIEEFDRFLAERAVQLFRESANRSIGIFSLSACADNHMWAYYSSDHAGIAVVFDTTHDFFRDNGALCPVSYSDEPIYVSTQLGLIRVAGQQLRQEDVVRGQVGDIPRPLYLRKRPNWQHEQEWRIVRPLHEAVTVKSADMPYPVYLFRVPPESISAIIIGYKASDEVVGNIQRQVNGNSIWRHLTLQRRVIGPGGRVEMRSA